MIRPRTPVNVPTIDEPGIRYQRSVSDGYVVAEIEGSEKAGWSVAIRAEISGGRIKVDDLGAQLQPHEAIAFAEKVVAIAREAQRRNQAKEAQLPLVERVEPHEMLDGVS